MEYKEGSMVPKAKRTSHRANVDIMGLVGIVLAVIVLALGIVISLSLIAAAQLPYGNTTLIYLALQNLTQFIVNIVVQLPLAGTVIGFAAVLGAVALIGVGGYMGYQYVSGRGRGR